MKISPISILIPFTINKGEVHLSVQTRKSNDELNGLKEFPGGKIEDGETPKLACLREVKEEVGVNLKKEQIELFKIYEHAYSSKTVLLNVFLYQDNEFNFSQSSYFKLDEELTDFQDIPDANFRIIKDLWHYFEQAISGT